MSRTDQAYETWKRDIQRARRTIETELLRGLIRKCDDEGQKRVFLPHRALSRAPELQPGMSGAKYETFAAAHQEFHLALVGGSESLLRSRSLKQLHGRLRRHQRLLDAALDRDEPRAVGLLQDHAGAARGGHSLGRPT